VLAPPYSVVAAVRTLRAVQNLEFHEALRKVIAHFDAKGWEVPASMRGLMKEK